jgi:glutamate racemase
VSLVTQGDIVAKSLAKYLENHPDLAQKCSQHGHLSFYTTDNANSFEKQGSLFFGQKIEAKHTDLA